MVLRAQDWAVFAERQGVPAEVQAGLCSFSCLMIWCYWA